MSNTAFNITFEDIFSIIKKVAPSVNDASFGSRSFRIAMKFGDPVDDRREAVLKRYERDRVNKSTRGLQGYVTRGQNDMCRTRPIW